MTTIPCLWFGGGIVKIGPTDTAIAGIIDTPFKAGSFSFAK